MSKISRFEYTAEERARHDAAYERLCKIIGSASPDAAELRRALNEELAAGFLINWSSAGGWTLLHWAVSRKSSVSTGLPQILVEAGADGSVKADDGTPFGYTCWRYVVKGELEYLAAISALLAGRQDAQPGLYEWKKEWNRPEQRARSDWLTAYIAAWEARRAAADASPIFDYAL